MNTASKPLSLRALSKTYASRTGEPVEALQPIDLEIAAGEFVVIVGPSGCGKTTLLNMLAGFGEPSGGEAQVGAATIRGPDIDRGMVFQGYALFPWLSVVGNVEFGLERKAVPRRERREIALEYLSMVGLRDFADRGINELSGGMKQRVAIARTFATEPSIIFMDEPFGALDALTRRFLQKQLLRIWQEHRKTVVFVTHSVPEAITLADRIAVMTARPGRIKTLISVDLAAVQRAVRQLPWVDSATVERQWPRALNIRVVEQVAAARWGANGLLNTRGELFISEARHIPPELPRLSGPRGTENEVARRYLAAQGQLIEAGMRLTAVRLDARGAWEFDLDNGITVRLGRRQVDERFARFVTAGVGQIAAHASDIGYIDMRYTNGFAIGWRAGGQRVASGTPEDDNSDG